MAHISSYLDEDRLPYPFCPGCGHGIIMDQLDAALVELQLAPHQVVVVVDIGCVALTREFWKTNWMLGLHGRSITYATGIKLANPNLHVIVLVGDGGVGIGGHHLLNAARRNIGITTLVFNNLNFGMTGGEHSVTTPPSALTATTSYGHLEQPLDTCSICISSGANFVARSTSFDKDLSQVLVSALRQEGFSLVDIWEPCTSYFVPANRFGRRQMDDTLARLGFSTGILHQGKRPEYSQAYRLAVADQRGQAPVDARGILPHYGSTLGHRRSFVVAGAAGKKIQSAAALFCQGAVLSGLWASQRSEYPVAVKSGFSVSQVILAPDEIKYPGVTTPTVVVALFPEGLARVQTIIASLSDADKLYVNSNLLPVHTDAQIVPLDFGRLADWNRQEVFWGVMALAEVCRRENLYPVEAMLEAAAGQSEFGKQNTAAIQAALQGWSS